MKIVVENVPEGVSEHKLKKIFSKFGFVEHVHISEYYDKIGAMAVIDMPIEEQANEAIDNLDGFRLMGREINVFPSVKMII